MTTTKEALLKKIREIGLRWERKLAKLLGGRRQPSSGAFGTQHHDAALTGDVVVKLPWFNKMFHIECKTGYGSSRTLSLKREWFTKVRQEAKLANRYPVVAIKFKGVTGGDRGSAMVLCINVDTWKKMMKELEYMYLELLSKYDEEYKKGKVEHE